jgi:hypothetical protein
MWYIIQEGRNLYMKVDLKEEVCVCVCVCVCVYELDLSGSGEGSGGRGRTLEQLERLSARKKSDAVWHQLSTSTSHTKRFSFIVCCLLEIPNASSKCDVNMNTAKKLMQMMRSYFVQNIVVHCISNPRPRPRPRPRMPQLLSVKSLSTCTVPTNILLIWIILFSYVICITSIRTK